MKLQIPTSPKVNRAIAGGFACAALALATGCQTVKKATPKLALKPKVERKILNPRDNVPSPYVRPRAIVKVRPDGSPTPHQAGTPRVETGSSITQSSEPVAIERQIPGHSIGIIAATEVTAASVQPATLPSAAAVTIVPPVMAAAPAQTSDSLFPVAVAPVIEPAPFELGTTIQAVDISAGRDLGGTPTAITPVAIAVAPVAPAPTEIVLQELPQEPVIEDVAITALADVTILNPIVEEPATSLLPAAIAPALVQGVELAAPVDLGQAPAEVEPLPTFAFKPMSYTVAKGDSLWKIGHVHGVTVAEIASFNNINASRPLKIGQSLELPPGAKFIPSAERRKVVKKSSLPVAAAAVRSTPRKSKPMPSGNTHSVVSGDSLSKIAQTYGVTVKQLCELNGLSRQSILQLKQVVKLGQVAKPAKSKSVVASTSKQKNKPAAAAVVTTQANKPVDTVTSLPEPANIDLPTAVAETAIEIDQPETAPGMDISKLKTLPHVVGENDTLEIISGMYNSTPEWIKEANKGLTNNADLTGTFKGKEITVPCRGISP